MDEWSNELDLTQLDDSLRAQSTVPGVLEVLEGSGVRGQGNKEEPDL